VPDNKENLKIVADLPPATIKVTDETKATDEEKAFLDVEFKGCSVTYSNTNRAFLGLMQSFLGTIPDQLTRLVEAVNEQAGVPPLTGGRAAPGNSDPRV